ncbi:hypothetical protein ACMFMF_005803 [Clarireedia jacksonii]
MDPTQLSSLPSSQPTSAADNTTGSRSRGRPPKPPQNPTIDLQRSRLRRAQKAYRIRKENHVKFQDNRINELETIVEEMSNVFMDVSDQILNLPGMTMEAKEVLKDGMERFLELGRKAAQGEEGDHLMTTDSGATEGDNNTDDEVSRSESSMASTSGPQVQDNDSFGAEHQLHSFKNDTSGISDNYQSHQAHAASLYTSPIPPTSFQSQPQHSHPPTGLQHWYDESEHISSPSTAPPFHYHAISPLPDYAFHQSIPRWPQYFHLPPWAQLGVSVIPYILAGRDSFAAHLYFSTIVFAFRAIRGEPGYAEAAAYFFRHKLRYGRRARVITVVGGAVDLMLGGGNRIDTATAYPHSTIPQDGRQEDISDDEIKELIKTDLAREGESESDYLSSWDMERYLTDRWRLTLDSTSVRRLPSGLGQERSDPRRFAPTMVIGWGEDRVRDTRDLVERLKHKAVTIGEGPRWSKRNVDEIVRGFLETSP